MPLKIKSVEFYRLDQYIELRLKSENDTLDIQKFAIKQEKEQRRLYNYIVEKLGINFKKYQKEKETEYY